MGVDIAVLVKYDQFVKYAHKHFGFSVVYDLFPLFFIDGLRWYLIPEEYSERGEIHINNLEEYRKFMQEFFKGLLKRDEEIDSLAWSKIKRLVELLFPNEAHAQKVINYLRDLVAEELAEYFELRYNLDLFVEFILIPDEENFTPYYRRGFVPLSDLFDVLYMLPLTEIKNRKQWIKIKEEFVKYFKGDEV